MESAVLVDANRMLAALAWRGGAAVYGPCLA